MYKLPVGGSLVSQPNSEGFRYATEYPKIYAQDVETLA